MTETRSVAVILRAEVGSYIAGMNAAAAETRTLATAMATTGTAKQKQGLQDVSRGLLAVGAAAAAGIGVAINKFAEFDHQMGAVSAATHETSQGMAELRAAAIAAGQATVFSATEAAQAETELAKAGVSTRDILGGGLKGALSLASAGNLAVADSAEIAATAMTQFALTGKDIPHVADLLAAGAGKAQGEVGDLAQALQYVGPVAHGMGVSLEETVGVLAEFASKGQIGERAGTGLRGVLLSMTSPSKQAAAEMEKLGINVYDANGQFIGLAGVADQLKGALANLAPQQRDFALGVIFGNQQVTAARVLLDGGAASVEKWTKKVNDQGYAADTAARKMDNLKGDLNNLSSSFETALINSGSSANDTLRALTQTGTGLINKFAALPGPLQATATGLIAVSGAVLLVAGAVGTLGPRVATARASLEGLGRSGRAASAGIGLLGKAAVVGTVVIGVGMAVNALSDELIKLRGNAAPATDALTRSLVKFADTGQLAGTAAHTLGDGASRLTDDIHALTMTGASINKWASKTSAGIVGIDWKESNERVKALDDSLTQLVEGGHGDVAAEVFKQLAAQVAAAGGDVDKFKGLLDGYTNAVANADTQQHLAAGSASDLSGGLTDTGEAGDAAAKAIEDYKNQLEGLNNKSIDAYQNQTDLRRSFDDLAKATKKGGDVTLDERDALADYARTAVETAKGIEDLSGDTDKANHVLETARKKFIDAAEGAGYTKRKARELADEFFQLPVVKSTEIKTPGMDTALQRCQTLLEQLQQIENTNPHVTVTVTGAGGITRGGKGASGRGQADGGYIQGPGSGTSDSILARLSNGEYVMRASAVKKIGVPALNQMNRYAAGGLVKFATGGPVDIGLGTTYSSATSGYGTAASVAAAGQSILDAQRQITQATRGSRDAREGLTRAQREHRDSVRDAERATKDLTRAEKALNDEQHKAHPDKKKLAQLEANIRTERRGVREANQRVADSEITVRNARESLTDASVQATDASDALTSATQDLATATDAYNASLTRPTTALSQGLGSQINVSATFMANLKTLALRGLGNLAQQLLALGGPDAEAIAADAVTLGQSEGAALENQVTAAQAQQIQLAALPNILSIITALSNSDGTLGMLALAKKLGISWQDVAQAVQLSRTEIAATGKAAILLADVDKIPKHAAGGMYRGAGSGTSDSNLAYISDGEYIVNAASTRAIGQGTLDRLNRYGSGGLVSARNIPLPQTASNSSPYVRQAPNFKFDIHEAPHFDEQQALTLVARAESLLYFPKG